MASVHRKKSRGPYDKLIKHAVDLFRQELAPLQASQQAIISQNEKITEFVRQIWGSVDKREDEKSQG